MKISVLTVVFNRADTIAGALESVACQTYPNVEHVVVDGASSDGTLGVIEKHRHANMVVVSEPDGGIYDALNKAAARASGDIIGLMHSDDFFAHNEVLAAIAEKFADPAIDAVYGDLDYISASDSSQILRRWKAGSFTPAKLRRGWMPPHPTLFLRRRVLEKFGAYDTSYRIAGDYDAMLRWFGSPGFRAGYVPEVLVKMRVGGESNRSIGRIIQKSREDYRALKTNKIGGFGALAVKNLSKVSQFFLR
jgi:glycosyltransferase involved in cell wall biosynthesis